MKIKLTSPTIVLLVGTLCSRIVLLMSLPYLSIYLTNSLYFTSVQAGYIVGMNPLSVVIASMFVSRLTKKIQLTRLLCWIPLIWGCVFLFFYFTTNFWLLLCLNGLNGCCYAIYESNSKYMLSITTKEAQKFTVFNLRYLAINIGGFIGPLLGMRIDSEAKLTSYLWLGSIYLGISMVHFLFFKNKNIESKEQDSQLTDKNEKNFSLRTIAPFLFFLFGISFSYFWYSQFTSTVSQYFINSGYFIDGIKRYALTMAICQLLVLFFQLFFLRFFTVYKKIIWSNRINWKQSFVCHQFSTSSCCSSFSWLDSDDAYIQFSRSFVRSTSRLYG